MKDLPNFLCIHFELLIKSPSIFPIYRRDSPIFYTYKSRGILKIIPSLNHECYYNRLIRKPSSIKSCIIVFNSSKIKENNHY